ncbi:unnamed protein product [Lampetra fluviatilis]
MERMGGAGRAGDKVRLTQVAESGSVPPGSDTVFPGVSLFGANCGCSCPGLAPTAGLDINGDSTSMRHKLRYELEEGKAECNGSRTPVCTFRAFPPSADNLHPALSRSPDNSTLPCMLIREFARSG